jgi:hypothetical protein
MARVQPGPGRKADLSELADVPPGVDPTRPSPARLYDYFLGGTNNFPADREAAEYLRAHIPDVVDALWANRGFHGRAAVWMARHGTRQLLDIGSGLPTQNNTHESVQKIAPEARVVCVDNDRCSWVVQTRVRGLAPGRSPAGFPGSSGHYA